MVERTGPTLPRGHWAVVAARRAEALGLIETYLPAQRAVPLEVVERALREAADRSASDPSARIDAEGWHAWLVADYPYLESGGGRDGGAGLAAVARAMVGGVRRIGAASPGLGEFEPDRTGAIPVPDGSDVVGAADVAIAWGRDLGVRLLVEREGDDSRVAAVEAGLGLGPVRATVGRVPVGYAFGFGGGVTLTGDAALDAVQFSTRDAVRLPGIFRLIGPVAFHTFVGWMREERHPDEPFIWGASAQFRPHDRLTFGIHRAALFGGDPEQPVTFGRVMRMLIGRVAGVGFEDQVVSVSARAVLPTESYVPLEVYAEWGAEDAAGAWFDVPGRVIGVWAPSVPGVRDLALGVEYADFATSCCGNPSWYRHWSFNGSWASRDRPLGHPVGGDGEELSLHGALDLASERVRVHVSGFRRRRGEENLYSPGRTGTSHGFAIGGEYAPYRRVRVELDASREVGSGWAETRLRIDGGVVF